MVIDSKVLSYTQNKRVLMVGGQGNRPAHYEALKKEFGFALFEWVTSERSQVKNFTRIADTMRPGKWDLILMLTRFIPHDALNIVKQAKHFQIPVVHIGGSYNPPSIASAIETQLVGSSTVVRTLPAPAPEVDAPPELTPERMAEAQRWIHDNPAQEFGAFSREFPERRLDSAWFFAQRKRIGQHPLDGTVPPLPVVHRYPTKDESMAKPHPHNVLANIDAQKVFEYLSKLSTQEVKAMTHHPYMKKTGHKIKNFTFNNVKRKILIKAGVLKPAPSELPMARSTGKGHGKGGSKVKVVIGHPPAAQAYTAAPTPDLAAERSPMKRGRMMEVMARIELKDYEGLPLGRLKEFAAALAGQILQQGEGVEIAVMAEPLALEIRIPV